MHIKFDSSILSKTEYVQQYFTVSKCTLHQDFSNDIHYLPYIYINKFYAGNTNCKKNTFCNSVEILDPVSFEEMASVHIWTTQPILSDFTFLTGIFPDSTRTDTQTSWACFITDQITLFVLKQMLIYRSCPFLDF